MTNSMQTFCRHGYTKYLRRHTGNSFQNSAQDILSVHFNEVTYRIDNNYKSSKFVVSFPKGGQALKNFASDVGALTATRN